MLAINERVPDGAEDMLDLIESLQGRRMEEQRAHLSVNAESISVSGINPEEPKESRFAYLVHLQIGTVS